MFINISYYEFENCLSLHFYTNLNSTKDCNILYITIINSTSSVVFVRPTFQPAPAFRITAVSCKKNARNLIIKKIHRMTTMAFFSIAIALFLTTTSGMKIPLEGRPRYCKMFLKIDLCTIQDFVYISVKIVYYLSIK